MKLILTLVQYVTLCLFLILTAITDDKVSKILYAICALTWAIILSTSIAELKFMMR